MSARLTEMEFAEVLARRGRAIARPETGLGRAKGVKKVVGQGLASETGLVGSNSSFRGKKDPTGDFLFQLTLLGLPEPVREWL